MTGLAPARARHHDLARPLLARVEQAEQVHALFRLVEDVPDDEREPVKQELADGLSRRLCTRPGE